MTIAIGHPIPHFSAESNQGTFDLNALRGKNVIIYFYPKDNTPGCTMESKAFRDHGTEFKTANTEIIGVSRDNLKSHCKFIDDHQLNFPLISDEDETICTLFGVLKQKNMMGKKYRGIERSTFLIDKNGILQHEWRDVSVLGHVKKVLKTVQKLK